MHIHIPLHVFRVLFLKVHIEKFYGVVQVLQFPGINVNFDHFSGLSGRVSVVSSTLSLIGSNHGNRLIFSGS